MISQQMRYWTIFFSSFRSFPHKQQQNSYIMQQKRNKFHYVRIIPKFICLISKLTMYTEAISHLRWKLPLGVIFVLTISLIGSQVFGLLEVEFGTPQPRLLIIVAAYLLIVSAIIMVNLKISNKLTTHLTSVSKISLSEYSKMVGSQTEQSLKRLYNDVRYKDWTKQKSQQSKSNIVYELIEEDSDENEQNITEHKVATMKKLF